MKRLLMAMAALCSAAQAKVDLVTIPTRDTVQLTIYNSADMTLVREQRALTLKEGINKLQFSWANTLIDPTSLEMLPKANADQIDVEKGSVPNGTVLSCLRTRFTPVFNLFHFASWLV